MVYGFMFTSHEPFQLQPQERNRLEQILRTTSLSAGLVRRARVLLLLAEGVSLRQIQAQTGMSPRRIQHWKRSWRKKGLDGLLDAPRSGRPKKLTVAKEAAILAVTEERPPGPLTHWSTRRLARRFGLSNVTIMRVWHKAGLQPHRLRRYMASPDPNFEAKAKDILGLYLHPPENTAVFCVDAGGSRFRSLWISSSQREAEARTAMTSEAIRTMLFGPVPLSGLIAIWNGRDDGVWASCEDLFQTLAEKILEAGEPLLAYDVANEGIAHFPKSTRLRQLLGLALARSGASDAAKVILEELYGEGHRDEETIGLLARTYKDLAEAACAAPSRTLYLKRAQEFYAKAYQLTAGYWSGVNAAALAAVLGEQEEA